MGAYQVPETAAVSASPPLPCRLVLPMLLAAGLLSACGARPGNAGTAPPAVASTLGAVAPAVFRDKAIGLSLGAVPGFRLYRDFHRSYRAPEGWKAFAGPDSHGREVAALVLDGSDEVAAAEMRIGASDAVEDVARCLDAPDEAGADPDQVEVGGVAFAHFHAEDAAMSHYLQVDGYRSVRNGRCVAIDLMVSGTRPEVYDPPRTPPFTVPAARVRLQQALAAVRWND
jgi:hypothetical protein